MVSTHVDQGFLSENRSTVSHITVRPANEVMRLDLLGCAYPSKLSFSRRLIRFLARENAKVIRTHWELDGEGYGAAVYTLKIKGQALSLIAFSTRLADEQRTDRVIAEAWDSSYALFDGVPKCDDLERLAKEVPRQEAGRYRKSELVVSRANRSVRLFEHVVERLAAGQQPDEDKITATGYLMRTTAVYGNGKFGMADRDHVISRFPDLKGAFQIEMLCVWLIRHFTLDWIEHVARQRGKENFVPLKPSIRKFLGIGNSTGLGMAPFLVSHPHLLHVWVSAREQVLSDMRNQVAVSKDDAKRAATLSVRAEHHLASWTTSDARQKSRLDVLNSEWPLIKQSMQEILAQSYPWDKLYRFGQQYSAECQELIVALIIELGGEGVDRCSETMVSEQDDGINAAMKVGVLKNLIQRDWAWARSIDCNDPEEAAQFWYVSEEKLEPRLGLRYEEMGADKEMPHDIVHRLNDLADYLDRHNDDTILLAELLLARPDFRYIVRRIQRLDRYPYAEIRDNLINRQCLPIDMLRLKLAFFGATRFDPKSDRWTRITLFQGAPLADEISSMPDVDDWWLPSLEAS